MNANTRDDHTMQEMIRVALLSLASKRSYPHATKMEITKVLYDAKGRLPDSNPYNHALAYYWYKDGPFCEPIYASLDSMRASGLVRQNKTDAYENYELNHACKYQRLVQGDADMNKVLDVIRDVVTEFVNINDTRSNIYKNAPYRWYETYKSGFLPKFESHCNAILGGRESHYTNAYMIELMDATVRDYPTDAKFETHQRGFMDFVGIVRALLAEQRGFACNVAAESIRALSGMVWDTFTLCVRMAHHDKYYNGHMEKWGQRCKEEAEMLKAEMLKCAKMIVGSSDRGVIINLIKRLGMEQAADRLAYLDNLAKSDPDEESIEIESLRKLAVFILERRLPVPHIGVGPGGVAHAVWWPPNGILSADFMPDGNVMFTSILRMSSGTEWSAYNVLPPDRMMTEIEPVVMALNR